MGKANSAVALLLAAAISFMGGAQEALAEGVNLKADISGLRNYKGHVVLYLWPDTEETGKFPDISKVQLRDERNTDQPCDFPRVTVCRRIIESLQDLTVSYTFPDVPLGDYAIFVFHDENNNGMLDTGLFKRPLEARGYSQVLPEDVSSVVSSIRYQQARFNLTGAKTISIGLRYPPRW